MVPPREQGQQRTATQGFASEEREDSQQGSQNSEEYNVAKVAEDMRRNAKRRRDRRRAAVDDVHLEEMRRMDAVITTKFDEILTRVVKRHKVRLENLTKLLQKRSMIEGRMLLCLKTIENAFSTADRALRFAIARRLHDLEQRKNALNA
ncbi:hypothetical protein MMC28_011022 [Mycoblastus sanguinarius]|nr:hypothetical protein [Mycoblastus sanguinarius]